jgi:tetratricopeptide (TPR) repeat protein
VLTLLGVVSYHLGAGDSGRSQLEEGLRLHQRVGDRLGEVTALQNLGALTAESGDYEAARHWFQRHVQLMHELGIRQRESAGLSNLGLVAHYLGHQDEARQHFQQALAISREIGHLEGEGMSLVYLALGAQQDGRYADALDAGRQALQIARRHDYRLLQADAWLQVGHALAGLHDPTAADAYQQALALHNDLGHRHSAMEALAGLARLALAGGRVVQAMGWVEEILSFLSERSLDGAFDPFAVHLTCYRVLQANHDRRAGAVLAQARNRLLAQAGQIHDAALRQSFLENVPVHRTLSQIGERR